MLKKLVVFKYTEPNMENELSSEIIYIKVCKIIQNSYTEDIC